MKPVPVTLESAVRDALDPSNLVLAQPQAPSTRDRFDARLSTADLHQFLVLMQAANAMRYQAQRQTARVVAGLAGPENLRWARLAGATRGDAPRKPRVNLWAEVNERNTLEILCSPEVDPADDTTSPYSNALCRTDYVEFGHIWPHFGARGHVVLRFLEREYLSSVPRDDSWFTRTSGGAFLQDALVDSLSFLLEALRAVCDVAVGNWPVYSKTGDLELITVAERARATIQAELSRLESRRMDYAAMVEGQLALVGLASLAEFDELRTQAEQENVKVTKLIFAKTRKKCSSLSTNKIVEFTQYQAACTNAMPPLAEALVQLARS